jgi:hypothetical protein
MSAETRIFAEFLLKHNPYSVGPVEFKIQGGTGFVNVQCGNDVVSVALGPQSWDEFAGCLVASTHFYDACARGR